MILYLSFEELSSLRASSERVLEALAGHGIAAPPQIIVDVEHLVPLLTGDITISTVEAQRHTRAAVAHLLQDARERMDQEIVEEHAAAESAVAGYFEYAHVLTVLHKLDRMRAEMAAMVHLLTGDDVDSEAARRFSFPD